MNVDEFWMNMKKWWKVQDEEREKNYVVMVLYCI